MLRGIKLFNVKEFIFESVKIGVLTKNLGKMVNQTTLIEYH